MFSSRTDWPAHPNPLSELLSNFRKAGRPVLDLTESNPTRCGFSYLNPKLLKPFQDLKNLSYEPDPKGLIGARETVVRYYAQKGIQLSPDQIFLTASTSEAYSFLFRLLANPGETVLTSSVSYPLFDYLAGLNDVPLERYRLYYDGRWHQDIENLKALRTKDPRALILVNPNNPTGNFICDNEKRAVNDLCAASSAAIIADEVFFDFAYPSADSFSSFAANNAVLTFTLSGVSKIFGLPQMKLSWIVVTGPEKLRREAIRRLEIISDTYLSVNSMTQRALPEWFENFEEIRQEILSRVVSNRGYLETCLNKTIPAVLLKAEGGWYAILKLEDKISDEEITLRILKEDSVYVHPGYFFDLEGSYLVLSLLPPPETFQEAVNRLLGRIKKWK